VLAAGLQWLSMFFTKMWNGNANQVAGSDAQAQASMKMMDIIFPLMTLWMAFSFTSLMGLYWVFQSVLAILQTFIISHAMPLPKFTEEQLKQMRREQKAVEKAQKKALKNQKYRSLHYIDEDDYDELPEVKNNNEQTKNTGAGMLNGNDLPNIKD
jgi:membrane protein insertase Oxa1/YidC/SpoIIIJ